MGWFSSGALDLHGPARAAPRLVARHPRRRSTAWLPTWRGAMAFEDAAGGPSTSRAASRGTTPTTRWTRFLGQAGFLHVAGVFTEDEMAAVSADMDRAAPSFVQGDGRSWWARTVDGTDRLVRMQGFDIDSPHDGRAGRRRAPGAARRAPRRRPRVGRHGVQRPRGPREADRRGGGHLRRPVAQGLLARAPQLRMLLAHGRDLGHRRRRDLGPAPGGGRSHRALVWPAFLRRDNPLPVVDLPTRTGDVTVHLSCTLHMAQPPVERERRVMYTGFRLPPLRPDAAAAAPPAPPGRARDRRDDRLTASQPGPRLAEQGRAPEPRPPAAVPFGPLCQLTGSWVWGGGRLMPGEQPGSVALRGAGSGRRTRDPRARTRHRVLRPGAEPCPGISVRPFWPGTVAAGEVAQVRWCRRAGFRPSRRSRPR